MNQSFQLISNRIPGLVLGKGTQVWEIIKVKDLNFSRVSIQSRLVQSRVRLESEDIFTLLKHYNFFDARQLIGKTYISLLVTEGVDPIQDLLKQIRSDEFTEEDHRTVNWKITDVVLKDNSIEIYSNACGETYYDTEYISKHLYKHISGDRFYQTQGRMMDADQNRVELYAYDKMNNWNYSIPSPEEVVEDIINSLARFQIPNFDHIDSNGRFTILNRIYNKYLDFIRQGVEIRSLGRVKIEEVPLDSPEGREFKNTVRGLQKNWKIVSSIGTKKVKIGPYSRFIWQAETQGN